jgi:hypothetical protein
MFNYGMQLLPINNKAACNADGFRYWAVAPLSNTAEEGCYSLL